MRGEHDDARRRQLFVSGGILQSIGLSLDELKPHIIELKSILGPKFEQLVPSSINDFSTLHWVVSLSLCLQKLKHCEGFDKHIARYTGKQAKSSYFVAGMASYLFDKVDAIELEPVTHKRRMADVLVNYRGEKVYLECKGIETSRFDFTRQHDRMLSILREYLVDIPHQIGITYRKPLSDTETHRLGRVLRQRTRLVRSNGRIIDNPELQVTVIKRETFADKRLRFCMYMIQENLDEHCRYPGHAYAMDGLTISISGPRVDYRSVLREKIRRSRHQSPVAEPYILIVESSTMLGELAENIRALSSAFQPETNTRFSATALVESNPVLGSTRTEFMFHFVSNPFAKYPVSKEFEFLFKTSTEE